MFSKAFIAQPKPGAGTGQGAEVQRWRCQSPICQTKDVQSDPFAVLPTNSLNRFVSESKHFVTILHKHLVELVKRFSLPRLLLLNRSDLCAQVTKEAANARYSLPRRLH